MASSQKGPWSRNSPSGLTTLVFLVAMMGVVSACAPAATGPSRTPSPPVQRIHTVYFTGQPIGIIQQGSLDALQSKKGSLRWHKQLDSYSSSTPSLVVFGDVVYMGRAKEICSPLCKTIGSIDALKGSDGTFLWHSNLGEHTDVEVVQVLNDVVYVTADTSGPRAASVYALRASNGSQLWRYTLSGRCGGALVVTETAIYLCGRDHEQNQVEAITTSDRTLLWHHQIDGFSSVVGLAVVDGVVYVGTAQANRNGPLKGSVEALRADDGTVVWHSQTNIVSSVITVADGIVYVGSLFDISLDALRVSDGSLLWQYQSHGAVLQAIVMDGVVYLASGCGLCYKNSFGDTVDALRVNDGSHLWRYHIDPAFLQLGGEYDDVQVVVADGMVYIGTLHGIIALDAHYGNKRWFHPADNYVYALAVGP